MTGDDRIFPSLPVTTFGTQDVLGYLVGLQNDGHEIYGTREYGYPRLTVLERISAMKPPHESPGRRRSPDGELTRDRPALCDDGLGGH